jgi:hypothetical protein
LPGIRFSSLPRPVWEHILTRVEERRISLQDLRRLQEWVNAAPWAPEGDWYKDLAHSCSAVPASFRKYCWPKAWRHLELESSRSYGRVGDHPLRALMMSPRGPLSNSSQQVFRQAGKTWHRSAPALAMTVSASSQGHDRSNSESGATTGSGGRCSFMTRLGPKADTAGDAAHLGCFEKSNQAWAWLLEGRVAS